MLALLPLVYGLTAILNHLGSGERLSGTVAAIIMWLVGLGSITATKRVMSTMVPPVGIIIVKTAQ